jgi:mycofactocin precursor
MTAGSMVTRVARPLTVTNIGRKPADPYPPRLSRRSVVQQDIPADAGPARATGPDLGPGAEPGIDDPGTTGELLVEEVSIDGMCGVY